VPLLGSAHHVKLRIAMDRAHMPKGGDDRLQALARRHAPAHDGAAHDIELSKGECEPRGRSEGSDPPARAQHLRPAHRRREADVHLRVGNSLA